MYSSLYKIQRDIITQQKINDANNSNSYLDLPFLSRVLGEEEVSDKLGHPFFLYPPKAGNADRKIRDRENINIEQFNDTVDTIHSDVETIRHAIDLVQDKLTKMDRAIDRTSGMLKAAIDFVNMKYKEHRKRTGLYRHTYREEISDASNFDLSRSNVEIDTEKHIIQANKSNLFDGNIQIGPMSAENLEVISSDAGIVATDSNLWRIFIPGNKETANIDVLKDVRETTEVTVAATFTNIYNMIANTIVISTSNVVPTKTYIDIVSGTETIPVVKGAFLSDAIYTFNFNLVKIDKILIKMTQSTETKIDDNNKKRYLYKINYVSPEYTNYAEDTEFISQAIDVNFPITDVSLESTQNTPLGTSIQYYISKDATTWLPISPQNIAPTAPDRIINIGTSTTEAIEYVESTPVYPWNTLTPDESFGNVPLYNIIENADSPYVVSGMLDIVANVGDNEIIEDKIRVFRGIDDYSIEKLKYEVTTDINDILYRFPPNEITGTVDSTDYNHDVVGIDAFVRIENEGHSIDANGQVTVTYPISNNNTTVVNIQTNARVVILSYTDKTITLSGAPTGTQVSVTYHTLISDIESQDNVIIEVDTSSFKYKLLATDDEFATGRDVYYSQIDKKIYTDINNTLPTNDQAWSTAYISFTYTRKANKEYELYRTFAFYETDTKLTIFPFTQEEIAAGNLHIIDGTNVSNNISIDITGGWHEIITTQPYKTDPDNTLDVNRLTNKASSAGILLGSYSERRAYENPMRLVSTHILSNVVPPSETESFTYSSGKIYLNFIPEYLPDNAVSAASHLRGNKILAKEATYIADSKNTFNEYVHKPEKFLIEYDTRPREDTTNDVRQIYIKGEFKTNVKTHTSPSIFQYDVLFY